MKSKLQDAKKSGLYRALSRNSYVWLAAIASALVMVLVYFCFDLVPFGDKTILRMDLYHQYGPLFAELYERLTGGGSFLYSWNTGLGSSFLGNFFNYLASPLSFLVLLFGHENVPEAISFLILVKASLASAAFSYYLRRAFRRNDITIAAFGVLYSFCGFFIAFYWNIMWLDAMIFLPLVILGIEQIINRGKWGLYCGALALTMVTNFYMSFMMCLFAMLYFLVYYFSRYTPAARLHPEVIPKAGDKKGIRFFGNSRFFAGGVQFAGASVLSALFAAFALLPTFFALQSSSATSGTFPKEYKSYFTIFDFLANHLASLEPTIRSSGNDVLPNVYCGMIVVLLIPLYLFAKSISAKEKALHCGLIALLFLSFNTNFLNYIWHGFHFPNDLPYRFSFMYSFLLLIMAYQVLIRIREYSKKELICAALAVAAFIVVVQKVESKNVTEMTVMISLLFTAVYAFVLLMLRDKRYQVSAVATLLFCCAVTEAAVANTDHYSMDQAKTSYVGDLQEFEVLKDQLDARTDGFYRMELTKLRTRNDPAWYNYNGASTFSSMAYEKLSNLQSNLGMYSNYINSYTYNLQTPVYNSMFSLRYLVNNTSEVSPDTAFYKKLMTSGKFTAYENRYTLPIAYCVDSNIQSWNTDSGNPFMVQGDYFEKATGLSGVFTPLNVIDASYSNLNDMGIKGIGSYSFTRTVDDQDASITVTLTVPSDENLYLYVKSSNVKEITVTSIRNYTTQNVEKPYILDFGAHEAGDRVTVKIPINKGNTGNIALYAYGLNEAVFQEGYSQLEQAGLAADKFEDTRIEGSFTAQENGILYTSIPYDAGWKVELDGKTVDPEQYVKIGDALLGIPVEAGTHMITFHFVPHGWIAGLLVSGSALLLVLAAFLILRKRGGLKLFHYTSELENAEDCLPIESDEDAVASASDENVAEAGLGNMLKQANTSPAPEQSSLENGDDPAKPESF